MNRKIGIALTASIFSVACLEVRQLAGLESPESRVVAVFIDKTTAAAEWEVYDAAVEQLLTADQGVGPGDRVVVAPINAATLTAFTPTADVTFPVSGVALNDEEDAEVARLRLHAVFEDVREMPRAPWTHIVDAAHVAAQVFRNDASRTSRHLILLTDGQEESADANFRQNPPDDDDTAAIIERLSATGRIPDLAGANVYIIGAKAATSEGMARIEAFWRTFFAKSGAELRPGNYSRAGAVLRLVDDGV